MKKVKLQCGVWKTKDGTYVAACKDTCNLDEGETKKSAMQRLLNGTSLHVECCREDGDNFYRTLPDEILEEWEKEKARGNLTEYEIEI